MADDLLLKVWERLCGVAHCAGRGSAAGEASDQPSDRGEEDLLSELVKESLIISQNIDIS
jgi:hypothetical protein